MFKFDQVNMDVVNMDVVKMGVVKMDVEGWIPRNFKIFTFKYKLSFLRKNHKNDKQDEFPDFYEFTLYLYMMF